MEVSEFCVRTFSAWNKNTLTWKRRREQEFLKINDRIFRIRLQTKMQYDFVYLLEYKKKQSTWLWYLEHCGEMDLVPEDYVYFSNHTNWFYSD